MPIESNRINGNGMPGAKQPGTVSHRAHAGNLSSQPPGGGVTLSEGQVIRGEITDLNNHEVTISLANNKSFTATISDSSSLYIGQTTSFKVTSITPGVISLERLAGKYTDGQMATILKALEEADLQKNEKNIQLVRELLEYRMPVNKMMLQQMLQQSSTYSSVSTDTLVIMNKYNIPVSGNIPEQFENFRAGNNSLINTIENVSDELPALLNTLAKDAPADLVRQFGTHLTSIINTHITGNPSASYTTSLSFLDNGEQAALADSIREEYPDIAEKIINGNATLEDVRMLIPENGAETQATDITGETDLAGIMTGTVSGGNSAVDNALTGAKDTQSLPASESGAPHIPETIAGKLAAANDYAAFNNHEIRGIMNHSAREMFAGELRGLGIAQHVTDKILDGTAKTEDVFSAISETISSAPDSMNDKIASLLSSDRFTSLFRHSLKNIWTMSPSDIAKGADSISAHYESLLDDLRKTTSLIQDNLSGQGSESLSHQTSSMQENINFMEQLNSLFSYVQLPVRFQDQTIHSDLYVYTKKEELKRHPGKVSVLLHLDMEHLGILDVHIEKQNNKIDTVFYCSDNDNASLFRRNISMLTDTLNEKGYLFNASITDKPKNTDIVKEFIEPGSDTSGSSKTSVTRYKFDIRA